MLAASSASFSMSGPGWIPEVSHGRQAQHWNGCQYNCHQQVVRRGTRRLGEAGVQMVADEHMYRKLEEQLGTKVCLVVGISRAESE